LAFYDETYITKSLIRVNILKALKHQNTLN
jgi:hypothetical protein